VSHFGGKLEEVNRRPFTVAVRDAPLLKGKFPLLIFSHGNGGMRHQNTFQMDHLASHGYIVASPDHTGNAGVTVLPDKVVPYDRNGRARSSRERVEDIRFVLDALLRHSRDKAHWLHGALDEKSVGLLGHSFGGMTVCAVAAADPRVKAVLPMTFVFSRPVSVPILLMTGTLDQTVKETGNLVSKAYYLSCGGPKHFLSLKRGGHFSFTDMDKINPRFGDGIGSEKREGETIEFIETRQAKKIINAYTLAFFDFYLRKCPQAGEFLKRNAFPEEIEFRSEHGGQEPP
jgi:predicted dienelactone hydrolase